MFFQIENSVEFYIFWDRSLVNSQTIVSNFGVCCTSAAGRNLIYFVKFLGSYVRAATTVHVKFQRQLWELRPRVFWQLDAALKFDF